jgi:uncharacterized protein YyaL (SSP411 family)
MSMFLTADGKPFAGGTYWPPDDQEEDGKKYAGFKTILNQVHEGATKEPDEIAKFADRLAEATRKELSEETRGRALVALDRSLVDGAVEELQERFDKIHGGFGSPARKFKGTKFPTVTHLELLLHLANKKKSEDLLPMVTLTLDKMAKGGIYDQLGGGFHRYSTERTWTVPHFEKMLYDNGQLAEIYAQAYAKTKDPLYRRVVEETLAYVRREMLSPEGAFYSSQDAETHHEEGRFYVWTEQEIDDALPNKDEAKLARKVFGADEPPNFEGKYHIFTLRRPLADVAADLKLTAAEAQARLAVVKRKLFEARGKRERPFVNRIAYTSWSGLMIAGFAEAGRALKEPAHVATAARAADFILARQVTKDGRLLHAYGAQPGKAPAAQGNGYLEDYAYLVHGLLALHEATGEKKWLDRARGLTDTMIRFHGDAKVGGYYFTANDHEKLFARSKDQYDGATPSGNSLALYNLVRLWRRTGEERYRAEAEKGFRSFAGAMKAGPSARTTMLLALSTYLDAAKK